MPEERSAGPRESRRYRGALLLRQAKHARAVEKLADGGEILAGKLSHEPRCLRTNHRMAEPAGRGWSPSIPRFIGCRVLLEVPHRHRRAGRPLHVRIELSVPGQDVIVNHEPTLNATVRPAHRKNDELDGRHEDASVTIHGAFAVARRRLEDVARRQRGDVKHKRTRAVSSQQEC